MNELRNLLGLPRLLGPNDHQQDFIKLRCYCDFEPFGIASEAWDEVWELVLPQIQHHWKSLYGWKPGNPELPMLFKGRTMNEVIIKAKTFLTEAASILNK